MKSTDLKSTDYAAFYANYIKKLPNEDLIRLLIKSGADTEHYFSVLPEEKRLFRYAEGKWSLKEVLLHLIDTERILTYRALRFARRDGTILPGFDQDAFVANSAADHIPWEHLMEEYHHVRKATIRMFRNFGPDTLQLCGNGSGSHMSVAAAGFIVVGHEMHHLQIIEERYL